VFGDSLSDIGIMAKTGMGKFAKGIGQMTVNPTGRYSDCRNWTDHMFEMATGVSLVKGDAKTTMAASKKHQSFGPLSLWNGTPDKWFRYANYAMGGACGDIPNALSKRIALSTMKDEVKSFKNDFGKNAVVDEQFLFIVWFGANDLYTAGLPANRMGAVAEKIARKRRAEIVALMGPNTARFMFVNLGMPLAAARYQEVYERRLQKSAAARARLMTAQRSKHDLEVLNRFDKTRKMVNNFESGALLFNNTLRNIAEGNGDTYVDMASIIARESVSGLLDQLGLVEGVQEEGSSKYFVSAKDYDSRDASMLVSTSDKAHPTDRVYRLMWEKMRETLWERQFTFGNLPA
jgi:phospholipase/lecithinase/hemolysin